MKIIKHCLGHGFVSTDGKRGEYGLGYFSQLGLSAEVPGKQTCYNQIALIMKAIDPNKKYTLVLEEAVEK